MYVYVCSCTRVCTWVRLCLQAAAATGLDGGAAHWAAHFALVYVLVLEAHKRRLRLGHLPCSTALPVALLAACRRGIGTAPRRIRITRAHETRSVEEAEAGELLLGLPYVLLPLELVR